jgi:D-lactate dehydrogenase (cytochrome)
MNRVVRVSAEDLDATVEAGVTRLQLNKALNNTGLTFPSILARTRRLAAWRRPAPRTTAVRPVAERDGPTVVLADGSIVTTTRARKSAAGYDLTRLFVGSRARSSSRVTVRLHPLRRRFLRHLRVRFRSRAPSRR